MSTELDDNMFIINAADQSKILTYDVSAISTSTIQTHRIMDFTGYVPVSVGAITQTGISGNQFDTLATGAVAALVCVYMEVITAATSGTYSVAISWTDHIGAKSEKPAADLNIGLTGKSAGTVFVYAGGGSTIDCTVTFTAKVGTPDCGLTVRCIPLG